MKQHIDLLCEMLVESKRSISMAYMDWTAELDLAASQRERHGGKRDQHQHPARIHLAQERRLCLHLRADPLDGLVMGLRQRSSIGCEVVRDVLQRVLILWTRRDHLLDQPTLVELLSMRQDIGDDGNANRAAGIARRIDYGRGLVGLGWVNAVKGCGHDRNEDHRQSDAE